VRHNEQEAILVSLLGVTVGVGLTFIARLGVTRMTTLVVEIEPRWVAIAFLSVTSVSVI
jgi:ABC-type antimicrobial peptide transport system permease subunit